MLNQEERDLELALSLQEQEIEERRAWVVALAGGQQYTRGQHHQRLTLQHPLLYTEFTQGWDERKHRKKEDLSELSDTGHSIVHPCRHRNSSRSLVWLKKPPAIY